MGLFMAHTKIPFYNALIISIQIETVDKKKKMKRKEEARALILHHAFSQGLMGKKIFKIFCSSFSMQMQNANLRYATGKTNLEPMSTQHSTFTSFIGDCGTTIPNNKSCATAIANSTLSSNEQREQV
jgi:hypothetical protein